MMLLYHSMSHNSTLNDTLSGPILSSPPTVFGHKKNLLPSPKGMVLFYHGFAYKRIRPLTPAVFVCIK